MRIEKIEKLRKPEKNKKIKTRERLKLGFSYLSLRRDIESLI